MRKLIIVLCVFCNTFALFAEQKPNVVFILVDDLGWKDLSCYGSTFYDSPNIDAFAGTGIKFTNAYSASPVCSPARAAILTGKHPVNVNITDWIPGLHLENTKLETPTFLHNLPLEELTMAEAFKQNGYTTFFAGKWHLGETEEFWPEHQGFDVNKGGYAAGSPKGGYYSPYKNPRLSDGPDGEYLTDRLTDESIAFIEKSKSDPFFLYLSYYTVHTPIQGCNKYDEFYKNKALGLPNNGKPEFKAERNGLTRQTQSDYKYAAMIRSLDDNVGRLLAKLGELGLDQNTIVVFTSDNGGLSTKANTSSPTSELPLRAGKGWCYEGGIRVPAIIRYPGMKNAGTISDLPIIGMDFYPTLLDLAGLPLLPLQHVDGESVLKYLDNPNVNEKRTLVWHYPHYHGSTWAPGSAIRYGDWKLIEFYEENKIELYNLKQHLGEKKDLADKYPERVEEMRTMMHKYIQYRGGQFPQKIN